MIVNFKDSHFNATAIVFFIILLIIIFYDVKCVKWKLDVAIIKPLHLAKVAKNSSKHVTKNALTKARLQLLLVLAAIKNGKSMSCQKY